MRNLTHIFLLALAGLTLLFSCGTEPEDTGGEVIGEEVPTADVTPVPFPDPGIAGFSFPEDSNVINNWLAEEDWESITRHAWGIWTGLTDVVDADCDGNTLRVFETWTTPEDIVAALKGNANPPAMSCGRAPLTVPTQLGHVPMMVGGESPDTVVYESVAYSPAAATYALDNRIFERDKLNALYASGVRSVVFPNDAITIKPVFRIIPQDATAYSIKVWPGPPNPAQPYHETAWTACAYVSTDGTGQGDGSVDVNCTGTATPQTTYNVEDFIHFKLTAADSAYFVSEFFDGSAEKIKEGDYAVLVGMHVASREIERWTWQSFWWAPNPDSPNAPSSESIANLRPAELMGAPRHYAMTTAYSMVWPAQPARGGQSVGEPVYAYNAYLEAPFDSGVFGWKSEITGPNGEKIVNQFGVETNCMSCHILANYDPAKAKTGEMFLYAADTYISLADTFYTNKLRADFAWSLTANIFPDSAAVVKMMNDMK